MRHVVVVVALLGAGCAPPAAECLADDVVFGEDADDDVVLDLAPLDCTTGSLLVENTLVEELAFPALTEVRGALVVSDNLALRRVRLPELVRVGALFELSGNPQLLELALPALEEVGGDLLVRNNEQLPPGGLEAAFDGVEVAGERVLEP